RIDGVVWQSIDGWAIDEEIKRVQLGIARGGDVAIQIGFRDASPMELPHPHAGPLAQLNDRAELYRLRRAGLGAGGDEPVPLSVVAERALVGMAVERAPRHHAEGTGGHAGRAAVADVGLDEDVLELRVDDGARRARLLAGSGDAMLADVAHHQPAPVLRFVEQPL